MYGRILAAVLAAALAWLPSASPAVGAHSDDTPWGYHAPYAPARSHFSSEFPPTCRPTLVVGYVRHGARQPTPGHLRRMKAVVEKVKSAQAVCPHGRLSFLGNLPIDAYPTQQDLTEYGEREMVDAGAAFGGRYSNLAYNTVLQFRTLPRDRIDKSARLFLDGFMSVHAGLRRPEVQHQPELPKVKDEVEAAEKWKEEELPKIAERLNREIGCPTLFDANDVLALMDLCPHEAVLTHPHTQRPQSCSLFTAADWAVYEQLHSIERYHRNVAPQRSLPTQAEQWWAELAAMLQKPRQALRATFGSQTLLINMQARLRLLENMVPPGQGPRGSHGGGSGQEQFEARHWLRFGARLYVERLACDGGGKYVRVLQNDAVLPLPWCQQDEWGRCTLARFVRELTTTRRSARKSLSYQHRLANH